MTFLDRIEEEHEGKFSEDLTRYFKKVNDTTQHMTRLLDDLLNFSRISRLNKRFIPTDLNEVLQNVLSDLDEMIRQKGASVMAIVLPSVEAIPLQIAQLLHHLLHNSLKFSTPEKVPVVQVMSRVLEQESLIGFPQLDQELEYTEIIFRDNGIGFHSDNAERIFKLFQRLHGNAEYPGTGVGLAIVQKVVESHDGYICAKGEPGNGATFTVYLPAE
jgi:light-regulated signal transduction histidine kinase (bacteriophytochrome)